MPGLRAAVWSRMKAHGEFGQYSLVTKLLRVFVKRWLVEYYSDAPAMFRRITGESSWRNEWRNAQSRCRESADIRFGKRLSNQGQPPSRQFFARTSRVDYCDSRIACSWGLEYKIFMSEARLPRLTRLAIAGYFDVILNRKAKRACLYSFKEASK